MKTNLGLSYSQKMAKKKFDERFYGQINEYLPKSPKSKELLFLLYDE